MRREEFPLSGFRGAILTLDEFEEIALMPLASFSVTTGRTRY
jgi:hypothetical protein